MIVLRSELGGQDLSFAEIPPGNFVFLGGTVGTNNYRPEFITRLVEIEPSLRDKLFDPTVEEGTWSEADRIREESAKAKAAYHLYYITNPGNKSGVSLYSLAEAVDSVHKRHDRTLVVFDKDATYDMHQTKQIAAIKELLRERQAFSFDGLGEVAGWLAGKLTEDPEVTEAAITDRTTTAQIPRKLPPKSELRARLLAASWWLGTIGSDRTIETSFESVDPKNASRAKAIIIRAAQIAPSAIGSRLNDDHGERDYSDTVTVWRKAYYQPAAR